ncbi:hypothetical protein B5X24_HaOG205367 [Helicoverpa armigera]|nr:hypothetical protein B5X24_HaOG205367 [Helicoverpa armigera]
MVEWRGEGARPHASWSAAGARRRRGGDASYFLPRGRLSQSRTDVAAPTVSYDRSTLNLIHFNLTKVPADSAEEGLISVGHRFTTDSSL